MSSKPSFHTNARSSRGGHLLFIGRLAVSLELMTEGLRIGSVTQDFALRVVTPGALICYLLSLLSPWTITPISQSPVAGAFGFLVIGTASYLLYSLLYVWLISRSRLMS